jgi:hypothetical protein
VPEAHAIDIVHDDEEGTVVRLVEIAHVHGVHMLQLAGSLCLLAKALDESWVFGEGRRHDLERAHFLQAGVHGLVDGAHAAFPKLAQDAVLTLDDCAGFPGAHLR